jgi:hypothetical protein
MIDGTQLQAALELSPDHLHALQLLVAEGEVGGSEGIVIAVHDELAVELRERLDVGLIDPRVTVRGEAHVAAVRPTRIERQIEQIKRALLTLGAMHPGVLSKQYSACQKPGCACVDLVNPKKHGPFYQFSYAHAGKSTPHFERPGNVTQIKKELAAFKRFRTLTQKWVSLELALSQLRLEQARREEDEK